jgi:peptide/nickel transport system permease protein
MALPTGPPRARIVRGTLNPLMSATLDNATVKAMPEESPHGSTLAQLTRALQSPPVMAALVILGIVVLAAIFAPLLGTTDPIAIDPGRRLSRLSPQHWLGTDAFGRDVYSRVMYGARISLVVGLGVSLASVILGLVIGVVAGYLRSMDAIIMRVMDGLMAIPGILLAIALVSLSGASLLTVLIAIAIPEVPRVVRLVRSVILTIRSEPYVEAAIALGTPIPTLLIRHMVPNTVAPLIVQGTFIFASAMLVEAAMSFLGVGLPPEIPSWGNIMAEGRMYFQLTPGLVLYAGIFLGLTVLSINILGDAMRDALDPRMARKL